VLKKLWVIHPFLLAIFPILFLFAYNIDEVPANALLLPILAVITLTLILLLSLRLITKNYNKVAIITSSFVILFFSYGHVRDLIWSHLELPQGRWVVTLICALLWAFIFITVTFLVIKSRRDFSTSTRLLNIVAITLVAISLINIGIYEVKSFNLSSEATNGSPTSLDLEDSHSLPDIYYIILDAYARADTLMEFWDYDNSEFIDYLTNKGFYVASKSRSNYSYTTLSLPSSLNMQYIDYPTGEVTGQKGAVLTRMIADSEVSRFLKNKGYRYIFMSEVGIGGKDVGKYAEVLQYEGLFGIRFANFARSLIETSALQPFAPYLGLYAKLDALYAADSLYTIETLSDMPHIREPKFVFVHFILPHGPFIFDRDGNLTLFKPSILGEQDPALQEHLGYLEQLIFINKKFEAVVDELLSKSEVPPVIILQADHGPHWVPLQGGRELTEETIVNERMKILNAYFLPDNDKQLLYESITPVNSFRIVFNLYFDTDYELLKDESYHGWLGLGTIVPPEGNAY